MLDEAEKEIPRPCLDSHVVMVNETHEIFEDRPNMFGVSVEHGRVPDTNLHVLEDDCGVTRRGNT